MHKKSLSSFLVLWVVSIGNAAAEAPREPMSLFDGKSLNGWEGNLDMFRIENGCIVGGNLQSKIPHNEFLCTEKEYEDFELRLKVKAFGPEGVNAGIQFRSRRVPDHHEVVGYQADVGGGWWGKLYDESRRRRVLAAPNPEKLAEVLVHDGWNDYVIRCEGSRVQMWLNGLQTVDFTDDEEGIARSGIIGLQIHGGPPSEAWYKDIMIETLK